MVINKSVSYIFATLLFMSNASYALVVDGKLSPSGSHLATDYFSDGTNDSFYYDAWRLTANADTDVTVTLSSSAFAPWLSVWDSAVLPAESWFDDGNGIDLYRSALFSVGKFIPPYSIAYTIAVTNGQSYDIAAATSIYNPIDLGVYMLEFISNLGDSAFSVKRVGAVPVPAAIWLFGSGLIGLAGLAKRRKA